MERVFQEQLVKGCLWPSSQSQCFWTKGWISYRATAAISWIWSGGPTTGCIIWVLQLRDPLFLPCTFTISSAPLLDSPLWYRAYDGEIHPFYHPIPFMHCLFRLPSNTSIETWTEIPLRSGRPKVTSRFPDAISVLESARENWMGMGSSKSMFLSELGAGKLSN